MIVSNKEKFDGALTLVIDKINSKAVTCEDFNKLIKMTMIGETTPESIRDRVRRRTIKNVTDSHSDSDTGHQHLELPTLADRVQPKRKPVHQQNHGRARNARRKSSRTNKLNSVFEFIMTNQGKPITEDIFATIADKKLLKYAAVKIISDKDMNTEWLKELIGKIG